MYHIIDEECLSHCSPSDVFNIHQDPAQHWHRQMAPCAARPIAAQACLSPFGVTQAPLQLCFVPTHSAPVERVPCSFLKLAKGRRSGLPNE